MRARRGALPLVLAGSAFSVDSGVRVVERPSAQQLADLHAHAVALVHPSRHEGFGLTVAEAVAAGTPVIAADTPAIREVAPDARLFPPGDADALAALLAAPPAAPAGDPARLSWARSAQAHIAAYRLALSA
jgi:glycosyltransferase involved in cell wall biosynthesis